MISRAEKAKDLYSNRYAGQETARLAGGVPTSALFKDLDRFRLFRNSNPTAFTEFGDPSRSLQE